MLNNDVVALKLLVLRGWHVNRRDDTGQTLLMKAASIGHTEIMALLLDAGCNINHKDSKGWTALHKAVYNGQLKSIACLTDSG